MTFVLRKPVSVAGDGLPTGEPLKTYPAGTPLDEIPVAELAQLAPGHFVDSDTREPAGDDAHPELGRLAREAAAAAPEGG